MANAVYGKCREAWLLNNIAAPIDYDTDTIKVALVTAGYTCTIDTDQYYSSVTASVVATPQTLASKTGTLGVADAADNTFTAVTGAQVTHLVIYKDTGTASTSPLIAHIDTATNLPVTPNGGDITISWDNGTSKIFKI